MPRLRGRISRQPRPEPRNVLLERLIDEAEEKTEAALEPLFAALVGNDDTDYICGLLDQLDAQKVPPSLQVEDISEDVAIALDAFGSVMVILESLFLEPDNPTAVQVRVKYGGLLVERWPGVVRWLAYLALIFSKLPDDGDLIDLIDFCTGALTILVAIDELYEWQEELLYCRQTTDLICLLLCQTNPHDGSYFYAPDSDGCTILWLLSMVANCDPNSPEYFNAVANLGAVRPRTRGKTIASLVLRARHIAEIGSGQRKGLREPENDNERLLLAATSLDMLTVLSLNLLSEPALSKICLKHNVVFEYASALSILSMGAHAYHLEQHRVGRETSRSGSEEVTSAEAQAIWKRVAETVSGSFMKIVVERTPNAISAIRAAITGGVLHTVLRCFVHLHPDSCELETLIGKTLPSILQALPTKKGLYSLFTGYRKSFPSDTGVDELGALLGLAQTRSELVVQAAMKICTAMEEGERRIEVYAKGAVQVAAGMCSNREHRLGSTPGLDVDTHFRTCSQCHSVTYCSSTCQKDDWHQLHAKECKPVAKLYKSQRKNGQWPHFEHRRDYVLYLEALARNHLQRAVRADVTLPPDSRQPYNPNCNIFVCYFPTFDGRTRKRTFALNDYNDVCWKELNLGWEERVRRMCQEVEQSPVRNCLIEGIFLHGDTPMCVFVLVRFVYDEDAPEGRKFWAEESVWRPGPHSLIERFWDISGEDRE